MRPLTHSMAKQLLPIANQPILHRAVSRLVEVGIEDVLVIVGDTEKQVMESLGDGSNLHARVSYLRQEAPLGLAHCVKIAREWLGDSSFVMYLGDNMFEAGLQTLMNDYANASHNSPRVAQVAVKQVDNPSSFGVASIDDQACLTEVVEKPDNPPTNLALVGTYLFTPIIHDAIERIFPSSRGELEITDAIQQLINDGHKVGVSEVHGWWYDAGNPAAFLECNAAVLLQEGSKDFRTLEGVSLIPPYVIHPTAQLTNCKVGPNASIGPEVILDGINVSDSVLLRGAVVQGSGQLVGSIIGERSKLTVSDGARITTIIGDDCIVGVEP